MATSQSRISAVYMRGGTSKGVFFHKDALPSDPVSRDAVLLRVIGSPDPYGKQIDGMGGASSSTSKVVLLSRSEVDGCDVDYLFGQVAIDAPLIDWSGNCGNLSAAVGPFAISEGLVSAPADGIATVRIWQSNLGKRIIAKVPMLGGLVQEEGAFELDGVTFPAAEVGLTFMDPGASKSLNDAGVSRGGIFPTGLKLEYLNTSDGRYEVTMLNAGNPTVFVDAKNLGLSGTEMQECFNTDAALLGRCERLRAQAAVVMGIAATVEEATRLRQHTPKLIYVAPANAYITSSGSHVKSDDIDFLARAISMGKLHHAMLGTGAIAIAVAATIPGTLVHHLVGQRQSKTNSEAVRFGHPSGVLKVAASAHASDAGEWTIDEVRLSRSARRLMEGRVCIPSSLLAGFRPI